MQEIHEHVEHLIMFSDVFHQYAKGRGSENCL